MSKMLLFEETKTTRKYYVDPSFVRLLENTRNMQSESFARSRSKNADEIMPPNVFIVHGHNETMLLSVQQFLLLLGINPLVLKNLPNQGDTIIEKFERVSNYAKYAIVLCSADDLMENKKYRARQNVIFEWGYFTSMLRRDRVLVLYEKTDDKEAELPSDRYGILYIPYCPHDRTWQLETLRELKDAGFEIDTNRVI